MFFNITWSMCVLTLVLANSTNVAAGAGVAGVDASDTTSSKALSCITKCSRIILETNFDPKKNRVIAGDQVILTLNILASLPGNNPLKSELLAHEMLVEPGILSEYRRSVTDSELVDTYNAILLPRGLTLESIPITFAGFGVEIKLVLDKSKVLENVDFINAAVREATKGMIPRILRLDDFSLSNLVAVTASYFRSLWDSPFEKELVDLFETVTGSKLITYLNGSIMCEYKEDESGTVICIPLKKKAKFVIHMPKKINIAREKSILEKLFCIKSSPETPKFFEPSMMEGLKREKLKLSIPKLTIESDTKLEEILRVAGFTGLGKKFWNDELPIGKFKQKSLLKTTLTGVEAGSAGWVEVIHSIPLIMKMNYPHTIAIVVECHKSYLPLFMGYIGDPTLNGTENSWSAALDAGAYRVSERASSTAAGAGGMR